ncbi:MAG: regulatory protein RecX [Phycisphaeraceae bacterium]
MTTDPTITAIKPLSTDPFRVSVRVGRKKVATLTLDHVRDLKLRVHMDWTEDLAERVAVLAAREQAFLDALRIVRRRAVGTEELRRKLQRKQHVEGDIAAALERLIDVGYLNDQNYAESVVRHEMARKAAGPRLLRAKLYQKNLPRELINEVVDAVDDEADHLAAATQLAEKKLKTTAMQKADAATRQRRLFSLLARRGFDSDTIRKTLSHVLPNEPRT